MPRDKVLKIVLTTATQKDTMRVLSAYSLVALVHREECGRLRPASSMPKGWDSGIDWRKLPRELPNAWGRYAEAKPAPVVVRYHDGRHAF